MSQQSALESLTSRSTLGVRLLFSIWDSAGIDTPHAFASLAKVNFLYSRQTLREPLGTFGVTSSYVIIFLTSEYLCA